MRVCVEGNIGAGKSTALEAFSRLRPDVPVFPEPVDEWGDMLGRFYEDPRRWALPFSLKVLLGFQRARHDPVAVVERCPGSCRHVFSQLHFNDGHMTPEEWGVFKDYCDELWWEPDAIVYVHLPADQCHARMVARGRPEERDVDIQYLKRLEFQYETMLRYSPVPVIRVDGTRPPEDIARAIADALTSERPPG